MLAGVYERVVKTLNPILPNSIRTGSVRLEDNERPKESWKIDRSGRSILAPTVEKDETGNPIRIVGSPSSSMDRIAEQLESGKGVRTLFGVPFRLLA